MIVGASTAPPVAAAVVFKNRRRGMGFRLFDIDCILIVIVAGRLPEITDIRQAISISAYPVRNRPATNQIISSRDQGACHYPHFFGRDRVISRSGTRKSSDANVLAVKQGFYFALRQAGCPEVFRLPLQKMRDRVISRSGTRKSSDANVLAVKQGFDFAQRSAGCPEVFRLPLPKMRDRVISRSGTRKSSDANVLAVKQGFDFAQRSAGCPEVFRLPLQKMRDRVISRSGTRKSSDANVLAVKQGFYFAQRSAGCPEVFRLPLRRCDRVISVAELGRVPTRTCWPSSKVSISPSGQPVVRKSSDSSDFRYKRCAIG